MGRSEGNGPQSKIMPFQDKFHSITIYSTLVNWPKHACPTGESARSALSFPHKNFPANQQLEKCPVWLLRRLWMDARCPEPIGTKKRDSTLDTLNGNIDQRRDIASAPKQSSFLWSSSWAEVRSQQITSMGLYVYGNDGYAKHLTTQSLSFDSGRFDTQC